MEDFIKGIPKCELHMHICGNTEPELVFKLAERNNIKLQYKTPDELREAYKFKNLQEFLDAFKTGTEVIKKPEDLYDITFDYLERAHKDNVKYCELHTNPQVFKPLFSLEDATKALTNACIDAEKKYGIKSKLIFCMQRIKPEAETIETLHEFEKCTCKDHFIAVGLANAERNHPPGDFVHLFEEVKKLGLKITIHAGEEGPADYINQALELCHADRIDHGNSAEQDPAVLEKLKTRQIPLTMCPLSNLKLHVIEDLKLHPLKRYLDSGLLVTINSDDPAFFGGYVNSNFIATQEALNLSRSDIIQLCKNSYLSSFLPESEKAAGIALIDSYVSQYDQTH